MSDEHSSQSSRKPSDAAIEAASKVLGDVAGLPYMARARDYVSEESTGEDRARELAALRAADEEAERQNAEFVRRLLAAAYAIDFPEGGA